MLAEVVLVVEVVLVFDVGLVVAEVVVIVEMVVVVVLDVKGVVEVDLYFLKIILEKLKIVDCKREEIPRKTLQKSKIYCSLETKLSQNFTI